MGGENMKKKRLLPAMRKNVFAPIERGVQFMLENLFKGDLAVWDKELQEHYPELKLKRQPGSSSAAGDLGGEAVERERPPPLRKRWL